MPGRRRVVLTIALTALTLGATPAHADPRPGPETETWTADLSTVDGDDAGVAFTNGRLTTAAAAPASLRGAQAMGMLVLAPYRLAVPANRIRASASATNADVDIRGWRDGVWSEWQPDGVLPAPVITVQVRVTLNGPDATITSLRLTADSVATTQAIAAAATYRIFATREGLVGGTTANGHIIVSRDHFVALPSRRGLAPKNSGSLSVRVCTTTGSRCEYAPVWDVGPWNTRDDYWNPSSTREMWKDLPQGKPEAQAAYQDGYNGGKDQFGRTVLNPAGIDLADGTFWDGLKLTTNAFITVTYLWTDTTTPRGRVDVSSTLNIRSGPGTGHPVVGLAADFANVPIECVTTGTTVTGTFGTTNRWDRIGPGHFVSHAYVAGLSGTPPTC